MCGKSCQLWQALRDLFNSISGLQIVIYLEYKAIKNFSFIVAELLTFKYPLWMDRARVDMKLLKQLGLPSAIYKQTVCAIYSSLFHMYFSAWDIYSLLILSPVLCRNTKWIVLERYRNFWRNRYVYETTEIDTKRHLGLKNVTECHVGLKRCNQEVFYMKILCQTLNYVHKNVSFLRQLPD